MRYTANRTLTLHHELFKCANGSRNPYIQAARANVGGGRPIPCPDTHTCAHTHAHAHMHTSHPPPPSPTHTRRWVLPPHVARQQRVIIRSPAHGAHIAPLYATPPQEKREEEARPRPEATAANQLESRSNSQGGRRHRSSVNRARPRGRFMASLKPLLYAIQQGNSSSSRGRGQHMLR
jgi:hypothetical protein